jgi:hypothetical protein
MKFYTNTSNTGNVTFQYSGNVGIGTSPVSNKMTINSNGSVTLGSPSPSHKLNIYSKLGDELEEKFCELSLMLGRQTNIDFRILRSIQKNLFDVGSEDQELIDSFIFIEKILHELKTPGEVYKKVIDTNIFCTTRKIRIFREIDYLQLFEKVDA